LLTTEPEQKVRPGSYMDTLPSSPSSNPSSLFSMTGSKRKSNPGSYMDTLPSTSLNIEQGDTQEVAVIVPKSPTEKPSTPVNKASTSMSTTKPKQSANPGSCMENSPIAPLKPLKDFAKKEILTQVQKTPESLLTNKSKPKANPGSYMDSPMNYPKKSEEIETKRKSFSSENIKQNNESSDKTSMQHNTNSLRDALGCSENHLQQRTDTVLEQEKHMKKEGELSNSSNSILNSEIEELVNSATNLLESIEKDEKHIMHIKTECKQNFHTMDEMKKFQEHNQKNNIASQEPLIDIQTKLDGSMSNLKDKLPSLSVDEEYLDSIKSGEFGKRGEAYVLAQVTLVLCILGGGISDVGNSFLQFACGPGLSTIGLTIILMGISDLGDSLSPFPVPLEKDTSTLKTSGIFEYIRHPLYSGLVLSAFGFGVSTGSPLRLLLTAALFCALSYKMDYEEKALLEKYPDEYEKYMKEVPGRIFPSELQELFNDALHKK